MLWKFIVNILNLGSHPNYSLEHASHIGIVSIKCMYDVHINVIARVKFIKIDYNYESCEFYVQIIENSQVVK